MNRCSCCIDPSVVLEKTSAYRFPIRPVVQHACRIADDIVLDIVGEHVEERLG